MQKSTKAFAAGVILTAAVGSGLFFYHNLNRTKEISSVEEIRSYRNFIPPNAHVFDDIKLNNKNRSVIAYKTDGNFEIVMTEYKNGQIKRSEENDTIERISARAAPLIEEMAGRELSSEKVNSMIEKLMAEFRDEDMVKVGLYRSCLKNYSSYKSEIPLPYLDVIFKNPLEGIAALVIKRKAEMNYMQSQGWSIEQVERYYNQEASPETKQELNVKRYYANRSLPHDGHGQVDARNPKLFVLPNGEISHKMEHDPRYGSPAEEQRAKMYKHDYGGGIRQEGTTVTETSRSDVSTTVHSRQYRNEQEARNAAIQSRQQQMNRESAQRAKEGVNLMRRDAGRAVQEVQKRLPQISFPGQKKR